MFKILHIPSGHFLHITKHINRMYGIPEIALFKTKAQAGHAIQDYRIGSKIANRVIRSYLYVLYEEDYHVYNDHPYIQFSNSYIHRCPMYLLTPVQQKLPVKQREKLMKRKVPSLVHPDEFLVMETT